MSSEQLIECGVEAVAVVEQEPMVAVLLDGEIEVGLIGFVEGDAG